MNRNVEIRDTPVSVDEVEQLVAHDGAGAIVTFVGRARNHSDGRAVTRLDYEAYPSMATREMARIVEEIESRLLGVKLSVIHRIGSLEVGDVAVVCAASAAHRSEAFEACRLLIDEIKARVPIWKREFGPDGPYWVGWADARCGGHLVSSPHGSAHEKPECSHHYEKLVEPRTGATAPLSGFRVDCITVSDSRESATDESGAVAERLLSRHGASVTRKLVRDDLTLIGEVVSQCLKSNPDMVLLTGGTGIGPRDVTVTALEPLLERKIEGFGEVFRRLSFDTIGIRAILSRAVAGTVGQTLVFAVPGSPKAVSLAVEDLILPLIPHARAMLSGGGH